MKSLSLIKLGVAAAAVAAVSSTTVLASGGGNTVPNGTYAFQSTDGNTELDGSTVTFLNDSIVSWDLLDITVATGANLPPLTPKNSSLISSFVFGATQYGPDGWFFTVGSPIGAASTQGSIFWFEAQNELFGPGVGGGLASLYAGFGNGPALDPDGNWAPVGAIPGTGASAVPDGSETIQLLGGSLMVLAGGRSLLRRWFSARR